MDIYEEVSDFFQRTNTEKTIIGKTRFHRDLYAVKVGEGAPVGIAIYAVHGREYITAKLAFAQYERGVKRGSCWFVPLVDPDGALLSQRGVESAPKEEREKLLALNGNADFSLWKANGRGVDLNVNFPAKWGEGAKNVRAAGAENYIGKRPASERETRALMRFTKKVSPDYTVSYHTKGEEIYWRFHQEGERAKRDLALAQMLSMETGYPLKETPSSAGGYKDWCIARLRIPAFTVEVGKDVLSHPLNEDALADIIEKNERTIYQLSGRIL